ncbi:ABC transporter ATP-binding protein [Paenibacillus sp. CCS19]|uniref:ABC transporter ATP-binding protein n=1 Tax=Paenibacillus sp. CCS19 TaxID=3158387 RepID=UPI00256DF676|nr:ABC transporter ATP-binding protein [Paenibacillus cellulosilyticus]GMK41352.1 ABC transporter ATP-binding protein [Paenibacillus cellulosilyticus]
MSKTNGAALRRLAGYLKPYRGKLLLIGFAALISTLFSIISPKLLGDATNMLFDSYRNGTEVDFRRLGAWLVGMAALYMASSLFSFLQQYVLAGISQRITASMREQVTDKFSRLPLRYFDRNSQGVLLSRTINDIDSINTSLQQVISQMMNSILTVVGIIAMMLYISPMLTIIVGITWPLSAFMVRWMAGRSKTYFACQQAELGQVNGHVNEMFGGFEVVKTYGYEEHAIQVFERKNQKLYEAGRMAQFISGIMMPLMMFVGNIGYVCVAIVGGVLVLNGNFQIGYVQAFIQYMQQINYPLMQAAGMMNLVQTALASAERVFSILDEKIEDQLSTSTAQIRKLDGSVTFCSVSFGYETEKPVIRGFNLHVKEGQTVAIVGPTGAGKSTLINLLMRFYEADEGSILLGENEYKNLSRDQVRRQYAMVIQDTWLFNGTIRDNIAYGREHASEEDIIRAARSAYADDFIRKLPNGYDTMLGIGASNLSQGQKQLLTIARAILADPAILILDEATSSVDTRTEMNIQRAMKEMMAGRTSFVIAHRLSTIRDADLILVMSNGEIVEQGTHESLLERQGFYADLHNSQFNEQEAI